MRGLGFSPAPLVLGLVLGPLLERSLLQALTIGRGDLRGLWASAPAALMLAAAAVALLVPLAAAVFHDQRRLGEQDAPLGVMDHDAPALVAPDDLAVIESRIEAEERQPEPAAAE